MKEDLVRPVPFWHSFLWAKRLLAQPPYLPVDYTAPEFFRFMCEETKLYTPQYAKRMVLIHGGDKLKEITRQHGAVLAPLHYGSFFLSGGAIVHQLQLNCNAIVTHSNLLILPAEQELMWRGIHHHTERLHQRPIFRAGVTPRQDIVQYLEKPRNLLWAMMDVREVGRNRPEFPFLFKNQQIYLQTGAARLACLASVPFIPMCIKYNTVEQRHHLYFGDFISPSDSPAEMTQQALAQLEKYMTDESSQFFHDMSYFSAPSHSNPSMI